MRDTGGDQVTDCDIADVALLERVIAGEATEVGNICDAYRAP